MQKEYLVPASILIGCTIIGAGLFLGLRGQPAPPPPALTAAPVARSSEPHPAAPPVTAAAPPPAPVAPMMGNPGAGALAGLSGPAVSPEVQAAVEKAATAALAEEKKAVFIPKCWQPALKEKPQPAVAKFSLDMTFDPQGTEITRGLSEDRSAPRPDVANCLRTLPMSLRVSPPPPVPVRVQLPLEFP